MKHSSDRNQKFRADVAIRDLFAFIRQSQMLFSELISQEFRSSSSRSQWLSLLDTTFVLAVVLLVLHMCSSSGLRKRKRWVNLCYYNEKHNYQSFTWVSHITNATLQVYNSSSPDLVFSPVQLKDAGFYICRVNCGSTYEFSHWAQVDVLDVPPRYGKSFLISRDKREIWLNCHDIVTVCHWYQNGWFFLYRISVYGIRGQAEGPDPASASKAAGGWSTLSGVWSYWQTPTAISVVQKWSADQKSQQEEVHCKRMNLLLYYILYCISFLRQFR